MDDRIDLRFTSSMLEPGEIADVALDECRLPRCQRRLDVAPLYRRIVERVEGIDDHDFVTPGDEAICYVTAYESCSASEKYSHASDSTRKMSTRELSSDILSRTCANRCPRMQRIEHRSIRACNLRYPLVSHIENESIISETASPEFRNELRGFNRP